MKILYDKASSLKMPTGVTKTADELRASGEYDMLFDTDVVIDVNDGVFMSYTSLAQAKSEYGITTTNASAAVEEMNAIDSKREYANMSVDVVDLQKQIEEQAAAIQELAAIVGGDE